MVRKTKDHYVHFTLDGRDAVDIVFFIKPSSVHNALHKHKCKSIKFKLSNKFYLIQIN